MLMVSINSLKANFIAYLLCIKASSCLFKKFSNFINFIDNLILFSFRKNQTALHMKSTSYSLIFKLIG